MNEIEETILSDTIDSDWKSVALIHLERWQDRLLSFAEESNMIEGITDCKADDDHAARLDKFLRLDTIQIADLCMFNTAGTLRVQSGMNVYIGDHEPLPGGTHMYGKLQDVIEDLGANTPYHTHCEFEGLHPFTDGNGRTGRAIWLWQMVNKEGYNIGLNFLHKFYYQALAHSQGEGK